MYRNTVPASHRGVDSRLPDAGRSNPVFLSVLRFTCFYHSDRGHVRALARNRNGTLVTARLDCKGKHAPQRRTAFHLLLVVVVVALVAAAECRAVHPERHRS